MIKHRGNFERLQADIFGKNVPLAWCLYMQGQRAYAKIAYVIDFYKFDLTLRLNI